MRSLPWWTPHFLGQMVIVGLGLAWAVTGSTPVATAAFIGVALVAANFARIIFTESTD